MKQFDDLATVFQVGTCRTEPPSLPDLIDLPQASPERRALLLAGTLGLMRRAGTETRPVAPIEEAPVESARVATASAAPLAEALSSGPVDAVLEWAEKATKVGKVAPYSVLAQMLQKYRTELEPVLGLRGRWLAGLQGIEIGGTSELESRDIRQWIADEYDTMDWKERAAAISQLESDLRLDDEPILQTALGDRRKEVRGAAANLVLRLDRSQPSVEMNSLTQGLLVVEKSLLRKSLAVNAPEPSTLPKWLPKTASRVDSGPKALALFDLVRYTPPNRWNFGIPLAQVLDLCLKTDYKNSIIDSFVESALRFNDQEWIDTLFEFVFSHEALRQEKWADLCMSASEGTFERIIGGKISGVGTTVDTALWSLSLRKKRLTSSLSRTAVLAMRGSQTQHYRLREIAPFLDPSVSSLLEEPLNEESQESTRKQVHRLLDLRRRLLASLDQP